MAPASVLLILRGMKARRMRDGKRGTTAVISDHTASQFYYSEN